MKKKLVVTILSVLMVFTMITITSAAVNPYGSLNNFRKTLTYDQGHFSDVKSSDWFANNVATAYEYRLMNGTSDTTYSPDISITLAMTITLAARLHQMYYGEDEIITPGWMEP